MSADENEYLLQLINLRSNNSSRIDLEEELNRMERPSRVFNSHHHLSMPPVLTDTINMEQNEQVRSSGDNDETLSSTIRNAGNNEVAGVSRNNESDDDDNTISNVNLTFWRKDIVLRHIGFDHRPAHSRAIRRPKKFADQPYVLLNRNFPRRSPAPGVTRTNRRVIVSSTNRGLNNHPPVRLETPGLELPEIQVTENVMETDNSNDQYDDVDRARVQEVSENHTINANEGNRNGTLDIPNETPRTKVVPIVTSPSETPSDTPEILATGVNNDLPNVPAAIPLITNNNDNQSRSIGQTSARRDEEHPETYEDLNGQLLHLFECPVCFEHIVPPIYQCLNGHLICNKCIVKCENCPSCRHYFNSERNLYMEKVGILLKYPCKNTSYGCKQQMFIALKANHEQECLYSQYQCYFTDCAWKGYHSEVYSHMIKDHEESVLTGSEQLLDIMMHGDDRTLKWFLSAENEYFAVFVHIVDTLRARKLMIQVNLFGSPANAKQYKFSIQLSLHRKDSGFSQKLIYESSTIPFSEIDNAAIHSAFKKEIICLSDDMVAPFIRRRLHNLPIIFKVGLV